MSITMIKIVPNIGYGHDNITYYQDTPVIDPEWAFLPESIATPETENYPYAKITTEKVSKSNPGDIPVACFGDRDEIDVVTAWTSKPIPTSVTPIDPPVTTDVLRNPGDVFTINGITYKALMQIPAHGTIAVNTNAVITTLEQELSNS